MGLYPAVKLEESPLPRIECRDIPKTGVTGQRRQLLGA